MHKQRSGERKIERRCLETTSLFFRLLTSLLPAGTLCSSPLERVTQKGEPLLVLIYDALLVIREYYQSYCLKKNTLPVELSSLFAIKMQTPLRVFSCFSLFLRLTLRNVQLENVIL